VSGLTVWEKGQVGREEREMMGVKRGGHLDPVVGFVTKTFH